MRWISCESLDIVMGNLGKKTPINLTVPLPKDI